MSLSKLLKGKNKIIIKIRENKIDAVDLEKFLINFERMEA
jgi:hypothetical protein